MWYARNTKYWHFGNPGIQNNDTGVLPALLSEIWYNFGSACFIPPHVCWCTSACFIPPNVCWYTSACFIPPNVCWYNQYCNVPDDQFLSGRKFDSVNITARTRDTIHTHTRDKIHTHKIDTKDKILSHTSDKIHRYKT